MTDTTELTIHDLIADQDAAIKTDWCGPNELQAITAAAFERGDVHLYAPDSLADWLSAPEEAWPVTNGDETYTYDQARADWESYLSGGTSEVDWFRGSWYRVNEDEDY